MTDKITLLLKQKFFELAHKENYPNTPKITEELNELVKEIKKREAKDDRTN